MSSTPTFATPPIVELVLGAQFSPLTRLTAGHFGLFWKELGSEWVKPLDQPLIDDQFESFERPAWRNPNAIQIHIGPPRQPGRFLIEHQCRDRLIQLQSTRFHLNWRKHADFYPSYKNLISDFERTFDSFREFVGKHKLGELALNQWELTYIDSFPAGELWQTPDDWPTFLPGLFGALFPRGDLPLNLENRRAEWSYEITPKRGRLHMTARPGTWGADDRTSLLLDMTARGPVGKGGVSRLREGLDLGHEVAVATFLRVVDKKVQESWGNQK